MTRNSFILRSGAVRSRPDYREAGTVHTFICIPIDGKIKTVKGPLRIEWIIPLQVYASRSVGETVFKENLPGVKIDDGSGSVVEVTIPVKGYSSGTPHEYTIVLLNLY